MIVTCMHLPMPPHPSLCPPACACLGMPMLLAPCPLLPPYPSLCPSMPPCTHLLAPVWACPYFLTYACLCTPAAAVPAWACMLSCLGLGLPVPASHLHSCQCNFWLPCASPAPVLRGVHNCESSQMQELWTAQMEIVGDSGSTATCLPWLWVAGTGRHIYGYRWGAPNPTLWVWVWNRVFKVRTPTYTLYGYRYVTHTGWLDPCQSLVSIDGWARGRWARCSRWKQTSRWVYEHGHSSIEHWSGWWTVGQWWLTAQDQSRPVRTSPDWSKTAFSLRPVRTSPRLIQDCSPVLQQSWSCPLVFWVCSLSPVFSPALQGWKTGQDRTLQH